MNAEYEINQDKFQGIYVSALTDNSCIYHFHKKIEIVYNVSAPKTVFINGKTHILSKHNLAISDCYDIHSYEHLNAGYQYVIILPSRHIENYLRFRQNKVLAENVIIDSDYCEKYVFPYFLKIVNHNDINSFAIQANIDMMLSNIIDKVKLKDKDIQVEFELIDDILAYIETNICQELSLETLASHFGYSKYYFSRIFNSLFHTNINDYISIIRLQHTIKYIKENKCSVTEAALCNGFNSMQTFYRVLKKNYGQISLKDII